MNRAAAIFATPWFHRRFTLAQDGQYTTVTEVADWARTPYDELRKSLLLGAGGEAASSRVLLLAPARHGDGTTTAAVLFAASLATNARVLLLELNFRRPSVAATLGLSEYTAVSDLLHAGNGNGKNGHANGHGNGHTNGQANGQRNGHNGDPERAVMATEVANLFVLPNQINGAVRALPEVQAISEIVRKLRDKFDYIVIDAAPVLGYPDTPLLATVADGVLLIVAADATPVESALAARREVERSGACLLGAVVTRQRRFVPEFIARHLGDQ
jgi:Mrp family chromosome partitioning ATPase